MKLQHRIIFYEDGRNRSPVEEYLEDLPKKVSLKFYKFLALLEEKGPAMPSAYCTHFKEFDGLSELKVGYGSNEYRIFYCFINREIYLLHGFTKNTNETPHGHTEVAMRRMNILRGGKAS